MGENRSASALERENKVRSDLRSIRKIAHCLKVLEEAAARYRERAAYLAENGETEEAKKIMILVGELKLGDAIKSATEREARYMSAIAKLEPIDRTIILESYIAGKPYWVVGRDIGFSEVGVKKRVQKIIARLAELMEEE